MLMYRDFSDYVYRVKTERLSKLEGALKSEYLNQRGWQNLRSSPERLRSIIEESIYTPGSSSILPAHHESKHLRGKKHGHKSIHIEKKTVSIDERLFILDENKYPVIGQVGTSDNLPLQEIRVDGKTVGWMGINTTDELKSPQEIAFLTKAFHRFYLVGAGIFVMTALLSFLLSRHLLAPIKKLTEGTQALSHRKFQSRIDVHSNDELGQLASDFNAMAGALENYEKMRQQWIIDISHELRTPLSVLRGEIEALQDGIREITQENLDSLHSEVVRISRIVEDLHRLSLADGKAFTFMKEPLNPFQILEETLRTFKTRLVRQKIKVHWNTEKKEKISILADGDRLKELFTNLLENTLRYTDSPGMLEIRRELAEDKLVLFFEDSAPGVPEESLGRLFDRLYRVDKSRSRALGGSGLGLSICKNIVEAHGGEISAHKGLSGGLRIKIILPLA
jgi:two-component system sensor histidine kinase BaeS